MGGNLGNYPSQMLNDGVPHQLAFGSSPNQYLLPPGLESNPQQQGHPSSQEIMEAVVMPLQLESEWRRLGYAYEPGNYCRFNKLSDFSFSNVKPWTECKSS